MKNLVVTAAAALPTSLFAAPVVAESPNESCTVNWVLAGLESRDPVADANEAVKQGSPQFIGVYGFSLGSPGVPADPYCLREFDLLWVVPDTGDDLRCQQHARLQPIARSYALAYNERLLSSGALKIPAKCSRT